MPKRLNCWSFFLESIYKYSNIMVALCLSRHRWDYTNLCLFRRQAFKWASSILITFTMFSRRYWSSLQQELREKDTLVSITVVYSRNILTVWTAFFYIDFQSLVMVKPIKDCMLQQEVKLVRQEIFPNSQGNFMYANKIFFLAVRMLRLRVYMISFL